MERRHRTVTKTSPIPVDYARMVTDVFTANFDVGLQALTKTQGAPTRFEIRGNIFADEILLSISLVTEGELAATTIHASVDFDPKASSPTVQELLASCVDAAGALLQQLLDASDENKLEQLSHRSLAALDNVPIDWTALEIENRRVYLKVDKSNPSIDEMADQWLNKHDPDFEQRQKEEEKKTEELFFTGPKKPVH